MGRIWGIDMGGTKIECAVIDSDDYHKVYIRKRVPTGSEKGYEHTLSQIETLIQIVRDELGENPDRIGFGTPGSIDPETHLLKNSNSWSLNDKPLKDDLEDLLQLPIEMANDANCFALAETKLGVVARDFPQAEVVFGVIMGTGCGGGIVAHGKVINGHQGITGEWGHNFLDESGGLCYCGKIGCTENVISGPALEKYYHDQGGEKIDLKEIYKRYKSKEDDLAVDTIERLFYFFGKGISVAINLLDPDVIIIGGGVGNIEELYTIGRDNVGQFVFNPTFTTPIVKPILGDSAGVFGAAMLIS